MKSKVSLLMKLQAMRIFNPALLANNRDRRKRKRILFTLTGAVAISALLIFYSAMMAYGYFKIGYGDVAPMLMFAVCSLFLFVFVLIRGSGALFESKDFDQIMSLPVEAWQVVLVKAASVYLFGLYVFVVFFIPAMVLYVIFMPSRAGTVVWLLVVTFFGPLFPTVLALALGTVVTSLVSRIPHRQLITILLYLALLAGVLAWTGRVSVQGEEALADLGVAVSAMIGRIYPPALWACSPLRGGIWAGAGFLIFSAGTAALFVGAVSRYYLKLNSLLASLKRGQRRKAASGKSTTVFRALFRKERKRLTSSTIYALNTTVGCLLMVLAGIAVLFADMGSLEAAFEIPGLPGHIQGILPWILGLLAAMCSTTAASLSLEGSSRWIMCSLPVTSAQIFRAKIALNLTVSLPCVLIGGTCFWIKFRPGTAETVLLFAVPFLCSVFSAVFGMYINVKFPIYDWTNEQQAVKNSMSVLITTFSGMAMGLVPLILILRFPAFSSQVTAAAGGIAFVITAVCWKRLQNIKLFV